MQVATVSPIRDVGRIVLKPGIPSLPSGVLDKFPNLEEIVIPPDVEIAPDAFDNCPNLTIIKIVSFPYRADYVTGDALDYNGLHVVEISGDTERDITPECVLLPAEGYVTNVVEDIMVDVRYHDKSLGTFWVQVLDKGSVIGGGDWWTLYKNGTLDIYCEGDMPNYSSVNNPPPWRNNNENITSVMIRHGVTSIGNDAFASCDSLVSITIPSGVTSIGNTAFFHCEALTNITIPDSVTSIGNWAFIGCVSLVSITIPSSVTSIGDSAFFDCDGLTTITIPDGVTNIKDNTFYDCSRLTSIAIPASISSIGNLAFAYCYDLTDVYYGGTEAQWDAIEIGTGNSSLTSATIHYNSSPA